MSRTMNWMGAGLAAGAFAFAGLVGTTNSAHAEAVVGSSIDVDLGVTWTTDYYFRGVPVENQGLIFQPEATVTFNVFETEVMDGEMLSISPYLSTWMSLHDSSSVQTSALFEVDYVVGLDIGLPYGFGLDLNYTWYTYPGSDDAVEEEFIATLGYDLTDVLAGVTGFDGLEFGIYYQLAIGTNGNTPIYSEIGFNAAYELDAIEDMPVTLGLDFALGMSYKSFYIADNDGRHQNFGFASVTLHASTPLTFIPAEFGEWSVTAGVSFNFLNDNFTNAAIAPTEDFKAIGFMTVGVSF